MAGKKKWTPHEIVGDETVEIAPETPVSPALQAAADAPQAPDPEQMFAALQAAEIKISVSVAPLRVERIEQARALLELAKDAPGSPVEIVSEGIQAFKSTDGRTMWVVVRDGNLYSQEK